MSKSIMSKNKFTNQWLRHFAASVEKDALENYVRDQYIWHVFSFNLLNETAFLTGDAARKAYDDADKSNCIFCNQFGSEGVTDRVVADYLSAQSIDANVTELYVVAKDFSWTYIKTHENNACGPYFMKINLHTRER